MGWEDALETAQTGSLSSVVGAYKRQALREQSDLEQDLYARGYRGTPTDQIDIKRGGLGSLLQSAGILGAPDPEPMTERQKYIYERGGRGRQLEDMRLEAGKLDLSNAKDRAKFNTLTQTLKLFQDTGVPSPELLSNYPEFADDYAGFQVKTKKQEHYDAQDRRLRRMSVLAQNRALRERAEGSFGGADPEGKRKALNLERMKKVLDNPINVALKRQYEFYFGDEKGYVEGAFDKANKSGDPLEVSKVLEGDRFGGGYRRFYQQLHDALKYGGVEEDAIPELVFVPPGSNEAFRNYGQPYPDEASAARGRTGLSADAWSEVMDSGVLADSPASRTTGTGAGQVPFNLGYGPQGLRGR